MHGLILAAAGGLPPLVLDIGIALVGAGALAAVFSRLRLPTIAAFLVAGVLLGPVGDVIDDPANIDTIAQLGLILLLFLIGLEIDGKALVAGGKTIVVSGTLQFPLTVAFGCFVVQGLLITGIATGLFGGDYAALYVGLTIAASSTLLVIALFQQTFSLDTISGRISLALLVFQDVWAIVVLAIQPNLDTPQIAHILASFGGIALLGGTAALVARTVLRHPFTWVAKQTATVLVASLAWCFAVVITGVNLDTMLEAAWGLHPGLAVSAGMGALIAGVTVAALPFRTEITRQVSVVRDFFVTLFFVGIGMTIPAPDDVAVVLVAVFIAALAIMSRFIVMLPVLHLSGLDRRNATMTSARLAPISEFALVIAFLGMQLGHIDAALNSAIVLAFVITAVASPFAFKGAEGTYDALEPLLGKLGFKAPPTKSAERSETYDLALLGVHRTGSSLLHELARTAPEILARTLVVDFNVDIHPHIARLGPRVVYGDFTSAETLRHAGVDRARVVLCTIPDDVMSSGSSLEVVQTVRSICPRVFLVATAVTFPEVRELYQAGADFVLVPRLDAAQAALEAVQAALNGKIQALRSASDAVPDREEVLD